MNKFGDLIRSKREEQEMLLRHLSAQLDIDAAMLSKIERGEKTAKREHVLALAQSFNIKPLCPVLMHGVVERLESKKMVVN